MATSSEYNLAFQLFDGEEMNANMANFIGIHRMSILSSPEKEDEKWISDFTRQDKGASTRLDGAQLGDVKMPFSVNSEELKQIFGSGDEEYDENGGMQY